MEPDFQIIVKGLPEDEAKNTGNIISAFIASLEKKDTGLDLRRMHRIIVTTDFSDELENIYKQLGFNEENQYTNEEYAEAIAKVFIIPKTDGYEILPIIRSDFTSSVLPEINNEDSTNEFLYKLNMLHHELCHVHDDNKKIDIFGDTLRKHKYHGFEIIISPLGIICWSEYVANYLCSKTATNKNLSDAVTNFINALTRTKDQANLEITNYRNHGDLETLLSFFKRHGDFLVKQAAYLQGFIDGLGITLEDLSVDAYYHLNNSYFELTWKDLNAALREMKELYPKGWKGLQIYSKLFSVLVGYYKSMGLILTSTENGEIKVDIPFRPENTPNL